MIREIKEEDLNGGFDDLSTGDAYIVFHLQIISKNLKELVELNKKKKDRDE